MYVMKTYPSGNKELMEMTAKEYRDTPDADGFKYNKVDATTAKQYVKNGGHHSTPLYIDEGRVKYASE